jgi:sulfotransferase family protein
MGFNESGGRSRWQRAPIIIVGAHRSGTTATAHALELLGLQIGQRLDSHRESKELQQLHENYLRKVGATWHSPKPFLDSVQTPEGERDCLEYLRDCARQEFGRVFGYRRNPKGLWLLLRIRLGAAWGWKEPRTTLFAPLWLQLFPEARVIDVIRHPLAVAMSICRREMTFRAAGDRPTPKLDELEYCLRLALTYVQMGERLAGQTPHYRRVPFEKLQANPRRMLEELATFCGLSPAGDRLTKSAAIIRPENSQQWNGLPQEEARKLLCRYPIVSKLGYEIP